MQGCGENEVLLVAIFGYNCGTILKRTAEIKLLTAESAKGAEEK